LNRIANWGGISIQRDASIRGTEKEAWKTEPMSSNLIEQGFLIGDSVALARTAGMASSVELFPS
jgi:hypothetical protein